MFSVSCPSCGNQVTFVSQASAFSVCDACRSILIRQDMAIEKIGVAATIQEDGTPLMLGTSGTYKNVSFEIVGRIQVHYPSGFWNEWYAMFANGTHGWLGEAQGNYFVSSLVQVRENIPPFQHLRPGARVILEGRLFVVTGIQQARVLSFEGELPFIQRVGYDAPVVDLRTETNVGATIDYSEQAPLVFLGEYVDFDALRFGNLRELEGWTI